MEEVQDRGPCLGNGVERENPEPGGQAGCGSPRGSRAPRLSPRPQTQGALGMRWGWPLWGT